jgi:hypothetical protein
MNNPFAAIFGLGNQELFLISCLILFYAFVIWAIVDLMSNSDYPGFGEIILDGGNSLLSGIWDAILPLLRKIRKTLVSKKVRFLRLAPTAVRPPGKAQQV